MACAVGALRVNKGFFFFFLKDIGGLRTGRPCTVPMDLKVTQGEGKQGKGNSLQGSTLQPWVELKAPSHFFKGDLTQLHAPRNLPPKTPGGHYLSLQILKSKDGALWGFEPSLPPCTPVQ